MFTDADSKKNKKNIKKLGFKDIIELYQLIDKEALARFFVDEKPDFVMKRLAAKLKALKKNLKEIEREAEKVGKKHEKAGKKDD